MKSCRRDAATLVELIVVASIVLFLSNLELPAFQLAYVELPPPSGFSDWFGGVFSAGSYHSHGAHVVFVDVSVRFIDAHSNCESAGVPRASVFNGSANVPGRPSPYGIW
jgi:hypothetical protein